jgi:hypothetical protein
MFDWWKHRAVRVTTGPLAAALGGQDASACEYQSLYRYLRDRYANRVVLTFAEIEDLLGFSLPPPARFEGSWWVAPVAGRSAQSKAWTLAGRTAVASLAAQNVVFDRIDADVAPGKRTAG